MSSALSVHMRPPAAGGVPPGVLRSTPALTRTGATQARARAPNPRGPGPAPRPRAAPARPPGSGPRAPQVFRAARAQLTRGREGPAGGGAASTRPRPRGAPLHPTLPFARGHLPQPCPCLVHFVPLSSCVAPPPPRSPAARPPARAYDHLSRAPARAHRPPPNQPRAGRAPPRPPAIHAPAPAPCGARRSARGGGRACPGAAGSLGAGPVGPHPPTQQRSL
ncbi:MAG: hypothetical protein J3K34DRAFT_93553 [Monoraphidium minutum]|nr:MAG: hypothetical protein J3K34DRAFT_93553 [Monoraphidium minutum]